jgi:hypothetical protein
MVTERSLIEDTQSVRSELEAAYGKVILASNKSGRPIEVILGTLIGAMLAEKCETEAQIAKAIQPILVSLSDAVDQVMAKKKT